MKNPYHKSVEPLWRLGGLSEEQLERRYRAAYAGSVACGVGWGLCGFMTLITLVLSRGDWGSMAGVALGFSGAALVLGWGWHKLCKSWERLEKISDSSSSVGENARELAELSAAARDWKEDMEWSGRELRWFDIQAMRSLSKLERQERLIAQSADEN